MMVNCAFPAVFAVAIAAPPIPPRPALMDRLLVDSAAGLGAGASACDSSHFYRDDDAGTATDVRATRPCRRQL